MPVEWRHLGGKLPVRFEEVRPFERALSQLARSAATSIFPDLGLAQSGYQIQRYAEISFDSGVSRGIPTHKNAAKARRVQLSRSEAFVHSRFGLAHPCSRSSIAKRAKNDQVGTSPKQNDLQQHAGSEMDIMFNGQGRPSDALNDTGRRLAAVLNNATVAIFLMDERQQCIYMNRAAEELTGYDLHEVLKLDRPLHDIIHHTRPDGSPFPLHECEIDRAFPDHNKVQGDEIFVHRDGSFYSVAFTASPIEDADANTVGTIIEVRDTRDEKLAAERQKLLMNELNHRVRNTLATIQAVARQSLRHLEPETVNRLNGRIDALAAAHDLLTHQTWHSAELRQIVESAVRPFGLDRFRLSGPPITIDPKAAVSLSMALHELAVNAARFGSLSELEGTIHVQWAIHDQGRFELVWREEGGPPVQPPVARGFGLRFIERQLSMEFDGSAVFDFQSSGLQCTMNICLPPLSEPLDLANSLAAEKP